MKTCCDLYLKFRLEKPNRVDIEKSDKFPGVCVCISSFNIFFFYLSFRGSCHGAPGAAGSLRLGCGEQRRLSWGQQGWTSQPGPVPLPQPGSVAGWGYQGNPASGISGGARLRLGWAGLSACSWVQLGGAHGWAGQGCGKLGQGLMPLGS